MTMSFLLSKIMYISWCCDNLSTQCDGLLPIITKQILKRNWVLNFALKQQLWYFYRSAPSSLTLVDWRSFLWGFFGWLVGWRMLNPEHRVCLMNFSVDFLDNSIQSYLSVLKLKCKCFNNINAFMLTESSVQKFKCFICVNLLPPKLYFVAIKFP